MTAYIDLQNNFPKSQTILKSNWWLKYLYPVLDSTEKFGNLVICLYIKIFLNVGIYSFYSGGIHYNLAKLWIMWSSKSLPSTYLFHRFLYQVKIVFATVWSPPKFIMISSPQIK